MIFEPMRKQILSIIWAKMSKGMKGPREQSPSKIAFWSARWHVLQREPSTSNSISPREIWRLPILTHRCVQEFCWDLHQHRMEIGYWWQAIGQLMRHFREIVFDMVLINKNENDLVSLSEGLNWILWNPPATNAWRGVQGVQQILSIDISEAIYISTLMTLYKYQVTANVTWKSTGQSSSEMK
jgi:hypothetical protein